MTDHTMKILSSCLCTLFIISMLGSCQLQKKSTKKDTSRVNDDSIENLAQSQKVKSEIDPYFTGNEIIHSDEAPRTITRNIIQDQHGDYWFATFAGIVQYKVNVSQVADGTFCNLTKKENLRRFRAFSLLEDRKGNIWIGTIGAGIYLYDGKTFENITKEDGLIDDHVTCITEDKSGNIWFGTTGGVSKYNGHDFINFTTDDGLTDNDVNSIVEDQSGNFWFGTRGNACIYDGHTFSTITRTSGAPFVNVRTIIEDQDATIWLGGNDGLWRFDGRSFHNYTTNFVGYIFQDKAGHIFTSNAESSNGNNRNWAVSKYHASSLLDAKIPPSQITSKEGMYFGIVEDNLGHIWIGSLEGVYRYDGKSLFYVQD